MAKEENEKSEQKVELKKTGIRQYIWCTIACLSTILFVIWTGYWAVLVMIPVFIDIYITKYISWGAWKESDNPKIKKLLDWVDAVLFALVGVYIITTFFFQNYQIPTSSLEKSLLVGDFLCVNKFVYGARAPMTPLSFPLMQHTVPVLGTKSYLENPKLEYKRFAGLRNVERYDIVVFNYPSGDTVAVKAQSDDYYRLCSEVGRDAVKNNKAQFGEIVYRPVDRRENYVKRCVGLPGDTIELRNDITYINGEALVNPQNMQLMYWVQTDGTAISSKVFDDLGISKDDQSIIRPIEFFPDSLRRVRVGLDAGGANDLLYGYVNLTKDMVKKLKAKTFVRSIVSHNEYLKKLNQLYPNYYDNKQSVYPIWYFKDNVDMGNFPATWIPKKGSTIYFDKDIERKVATYERCIKNYEHNDFAFRDGKVYINGEESNSYTFKFDYYFMMGDNRDKSADSRMWGFVPEDHIVGSPMFVWLSLDKDKGGLKKIRWDRFFINGNVNK